MSAPAPVPALTARHVAVIAAIAAVVYVLGRAGERAFARSAE